MQTVFKFYFDQTGNRIQIYCISSKRFIHSTNDKNDKVGKTKYYYIQNPMLHFRLGLARAATNAIFHYQIYQTENKTHSTSFPSENQYYIMLDYEFSVY